jgi:hypothetical protein
MAKLVIVREPEYPDIHVHVSGRTVAVQYRGGKEAVQATLRSSPLATLFVQKMVFWSEVNRHWEIKHLLEHVAWELDAAVYAATRRAKRRCFSA